MLGCWEAESSDRPTFSHLVETLGDLLQERVQQVGAGALRPNDEAAHKDKRRCRSPPKSTKVLANQFVLSPQEGKDYIPLESFPPGNAGCTVSFKESLLAVTNMR